MPFQTVTIGSATGLHARPAALFVAAAARAPVAVTIRTEAKPPVPAHSMLAVLALGAQQGTAVTLEADGDGAEEVIAQLAELLAKDLDEHGSGKPAEPTS